MNLLDTLAPFGTVAIAAPIGLLGIEFLLGERPIVGAGFLAIAVGLVVVGYFTPSLKGIVADTVVGTVVKEPDEDGKADEDCRSGFKSSLVGTRLGWIDNIYLVSVS